MALKEAFSGHVGMKEEQRFGSIAVRWLPLRLHQVQGLVHGHHEHVADVVKAKAGQLSSVTEKLLPVT